MRHTVSVCIAALVACVSCDDGRGLGDGIPSIDSGTQLGSGQATGITQAGSNAAGTTQAGGSQASNGNSKSASMPTGPSPLAALTADAYRILGMVPTSRLNIAGSNYDNGAQIVNSPQSGGDSQLWAFVPGPAGSAAWQIRNPASGKCIDVAGQSAVAGAALVLNSCSAATSQLWQGSAGSAGNVGFSNLNSNLCMTTTGSDPNTDLPIVQSVCAQTSAQRWQVLPKTYVAPGAYGIINYALAPNNAYTAASFTMVVPGTPAATGTLYVTAQLWPRAPDDPTRAPVGLGYLGPALVWGPSCLPTAHPADYATWWVAGDYFNYDGNVTGHMGCVGGDAMAVDVGDTIAVSMQLQGSAWSQTITDTSSGQSVTYALDMLGQAQTGMILGINPLGVSPVGDVLFENIQFSVARADNGFCVADWLGANDFATPGVASTDMKTCRIAKVIARAQNVPATTPNP